MQSSHTIDQVLARTKEELSNPDSNYVYRYCDGHKFAVAISEDQIKLDFVFGMCSPNNLKIIDCGANSETHLYVPHDSVVMQQLHTGFIAAGYELLEIVYNDPHGSQQREIVVYLQHILL